MMLRVLLAVLVLGAPLLAHHSVPVNFDQSRQITIDGELTEIAWLNPHSRFRLDVRNDQGVTEEWLVEMGAVNTMMRAGLKKELFTLGDAVSIEGAPGWRGRVVFLRTVVLADGTRLSP